VEQFTYERKLKLYTSNEVRRIIIKEVQEASLFSVMTDTTHDNSHKDRLSVFLRYVNSNGKTMKGF
jgi:hypothetical protein